MKKIRLLFINFVSNDVDTSDFPIGIYTLKSYLETNYGNLCEIQIQDIQLTSITEMVNYTIDYKPDILGLSLMLYSFSRCREFLAEYDRAITNSDKALLVFGRNLATFSPNEILNIYPDSICVIGEGELAIAGIIEYVLNKRKLSEIPNICYKEKQKIIITQRKLLDDLNEIGFIDYSEAVKYYNSGGTVWIETSRGCPWGHCTFCSTKGYWGIIRRRRKDIERIVNEFEYLSKNLGIKKIALTDEEFFGDDDSAIEWSRKLAQTILDRNINILFYANARCDAIYNENDNFFLRVQRFEIMQLLHYAGLQTIYLGIETGSETQMKRYNKGITLNEAEKAVKICEVLDFKIQIGWLILEPIVASNEVIDSINFINNNHLIQYLSTPLNQMLVYPSIPYFKLIKMYEQKYNKKLVSDIYNIESLTYKIIDYIDPNIKDIVDLVTIYRDEHSSIYNSLKWFVRFDPLGDYEEYEYLKESLDLMKKSQIDLLYNLTLVTQKTSFERKQYELIYNTSVEELKEQFYFLKDSIIKNGHMNSFPDLIKKIDNYLDPQITSLIETKLFV